MIQANPKLKLKAVSFGLSFAFNPLGPRTTKVVNVLRVMHGLVPLLSCFHLQELRQNSTIFDQLF